MRIRHNGFNSHTFRVSTLNINLPLPNKGLRWRNIPHTDTSSPANTYHFWDAAEERLRITVVLRPTWRSCYAFRMASPYWHSSNIIGTERILSFDPILRDEIFPWVAKPRKDFIPYGYRTRAPPSRCKSRRPLHQSGASSKGNTIPSLFGLSEIG